MFELTPEENEILRSQNATTGIYSLSDFVYAGSNDPSKLEKERPDTDKEKRYLEGRYSAIPILTGINNIKPMISLLNAQFRHH